MKPIASKIGTTYDAATYDFRTRGRMDSPRILFTNTSNTYRVCLHEGGYRDQYLYKGLEYDAAGVVKVTDTSDAALTAGLVYLVM